MQNLITELAQKHGISQLSVAIVGPGDVLQEWMAIDTPCPAELGGVYPIYSITKTYIAVALLKLARAGKIDLDQFVAEWIEDAPAGNRYTVRQLLNHTSGLQDYCGLETYSEDVKAHPERPWSRSAFLLNTVAQGFAFDPGKGWLYSNFGYLLLREVIEKITGISLAQAVSDLITEPHALPKMRWLAEPADLLGLVRGLSHQISTDDAAHDVRGKYHPGWVSHGMFAARAREIALFFHRLFSGEILDAASLAQMTTLIRVPGERPPAVTPSYGLGIMGDPDSPQGPSFAHGGGGPGYALHTVFWPQMRRGISVSFFGNEEYADIRKLAAEFGAHFSKING